MVRIKVLRSRNVGPKYVRKGEILRGKAFPSGCIIVLGICLPPEDAKDFEVC